MKKLLLHTLLILFGFQFSYSQISIGNEPIKENSVLGFGNEIKGLLLPRVISSNAVIAGLGGRVGTLIYDYQDGCMKLYTSVGWTACPPLRGVSGVLSGTDNPTAKVIIGSNNSSIEGGLILTSPNTTTPGKRMGLNLPVIEDLVSGFANPVEGMLVYNKTNQTLSASDGVRWNDYQNTNGAPPIDPIIPIDPGEPVIIPNNIKINAVYLAQTHVVKAEYKIPLTEQQIQDNEQPEPLKLISDRSVLVLSHITSPDTDPIPTVNAIVKLNGSSITIPLVHAPSLTNLPTSIPDGFGVVQHSLNNVFYADIPKEWIKPGINISIAASNTIKNLPAISVGAPNEIKFTTFEIHAFNLGGNDFSSGYMNELASKLPTSRIEHTRVNNILFSRISIPPTGTVKAAKATSLAEYQTITGAVFGTHNVTADNWKAALRFANGFKYFDVGFVGVAWYFDGSNEQKGVGGGFHAVYARGNEGIFIHEMGHAISLPHWGEQVKEHNPATILYDRYPYKGTMHGINPPDIYNSVHVGPVWAFDQPTNKFIPPTLQSNSVVSDLPDVGKYKNDPMQGGGYGDQEPGFIYTHFSDFSVNKMRNYMESNLVVWSEAAAEYRKWSNTTNSYSITMPNNGVTYPITRDVDVVAIMAAKSSVTTQADLVYPPISYKGNLIKLFDPNSAISRADAVASGFCPTNGCDYTFKVVQGGVTKYVMTNISFDSTITDPTSESTFLTRAVNLPASNGAVTSIELLSTPNAQVNGLGSPAAVTSWPY